VNTAPVRELLLLLADHERFLKSPRTRLRRQIAAAGLARCQALLDGMCILREQGRADVIGLLGRALLEVWLVSLYVLLKGHDDDDDTALIELGMEHARYCAILAERFELDPSIKKAVAEWEEVTSDQQTPDGKPISGRPSYESIARQLSELLAQVEPGQRFDVMAVYDRVYRSESTYSAHPSVGLFVRYIKWDSSEQEDEIISNPGPPFPRQERLAAMLTTFLAIRVYKAFAVLVDPRLSSIYDRLAADDESQAEAPPTREPAMSPDRPSDPGRPELM